MEKPKVDQFERQSREKRAGQKKIKKKKQKKKKREVLSNLFLLKARQRLSAEERAFSSLRLEQTLGSGGRQQDGVF
jgi:hypothetical protein